MSEASGVSTVDQPSGDPEPASPARPSVSSDSASHGEQAPENAPVEPAGRWRPPTGRDDLSTLDRLRDGRMRDAAANLEFEEAAKLRDEIKRMKLLDLEFANEALTGAGEEVDKSAPKRWRKEAAAEKAEAFRKGR